MRHVKFVLVLAVAANLWECGEARLGEKGELSPRRRRCYDGSLPRRLKKKERKVAVEDGAVCSRLYPRVSCCPVRRAPYQSRDTTIFSTNNTECSRLLQEIKCAHCSPNAQMLFHSPKEESLRHHEPDLPRLCPEYCREFYYTCRGHVPELFQADVDEFCQYYGRRDGGLCFPDFHQKLPRSQDSNYLGDERIEAINRKHKHNCYCAQEVLAGLRHPVSVVHCGDGSQRLFILEKEGFVRILTHDMELLKEPFLDIHKMVQTGIKGGDERGLLSLAFHPNYKKNGKLYISYTTNQERWAIGPHDHILRVVEYTVSRKNPNQADTRNTRVLMEVAELHRKHLGGQLLFGPDGFLHIILGDGMITLDDMEEMDGLSDFTGSVLRVDVDTECCSTPYIIPRNNPYFNSTNQPPEIFAHGLHDPGRCAVDKLHMSTNGSLLIMCTDSIGRNTTTGRILQISKGKDYENEPSIFDLGSSGGAVPMGGFIYRGCQSRRLYGSYVFGDKIGNLRILQRPAEDRPWQEKPLCLGSSSSCGSSLVGHLLGFGEDELGEVYILASSKSLAMQSHSGKLYKLVDPKSLANVDTITSKSAGWVVINLNPFCLLKRAFVFLPPLVGCGQIIWVGPYPFKQIITQLPALANTNLSHNWRLQGTLNPCILSNAGNVWLVNNFPVFTNLYSPNASIMRPQVPKECRRPVEAPEMLSSSCSRECRNGICTPTGKCCCSTGWEGPFCIRAKCEPACRNGGVCTEPNECFCKEGFSGAQCEKGERGIQEGNDKNGFLDHIIDMTSYLLDLTSYIV